MATHSSILAWEIPWTEKSGGLQFMGLQTNQTQLSMLTPHNNAAIPFLGICPKKMKTLIQKDKCTSMFINLVQWLNRVWLFVTPQTAARQASLTLTIWRMLNIKIYSQCTFSNLCHIIINNTSCLNLDSKRLIKMSTPKLNSNCLSCPEIEHRFENTVQAGYFFLLNLL